MSGLSRQGLTALAWVLTGTGIALTGGRYVIRLKTLKKLKLDDYVHGLAMITLVGYICTYSVMFPLNYSVEFWAAGKSIKPPDSDLRRYFHLEIAVSAMFWIIIYLVKLAFLLFYRMLFGVSRAFMIAWWIVLGFTGLTFIICFISVFWACESPGHLFQLEHCLSERALNQNATVVSMWCALNVASDFSIMALPIWMLRKLQMRRSRKVGLAALFLIALIDVAFDIARTVYTVDGGAVALDTLWDILEPAIAVMISALLTYKALLGRSERKKSISYENLKRDEKQSSAFNSADKYNWGPTVAGQASSHGGSIDVSIHELARVSKDAAFTNTAV